MFHDPLPQPLDPVLLKHSEERAEDVQNRVSDRITAFAGSMTFVYIHVLWFGLWIGLGVEKYPFGLLTMIVSLEAIFLLHVRDDQPEPGGRKAAGDRRSAVEDSIGFQPRNATRLKRRSGYVRVCRRISSSLAWRP